MEMHVEPVWQLLPILTKLKPTEPGIPWPRIGSPHSITDETPCWATSTHRGVLNSITSRLSETWNILALALALTSHKEASSTSQVRFI